MICSGVNRTLAIGTPFPKVFLVLPGPILAGRSLEALSETSDRIGEPFPVVTDESCGRAPRRSLPFRILHFEIDGHSVDRGFGLALDQQGLEQPLLDRGDRCLV